MFILLIYSNYNAQALNVLIETRCHLKKHKNKQTKQIVGYFIAERPEVET